MSSRFSRHMLKCELYIANMIQLERLLFQNCFIVDNTTSFHLYYAD